MNDTEQIQETPPRLLTVPQAPVPQTCTGVLCDYGLPSEPFQITDFPPDFSWMTQIPVFLQMIRFDENTIGDFEYINLPQVKTWNPYNGKQFTPWLAFPFCCSRWWNGKVKLTFMAIKPSKVTGKILFMYYPDNASFGYYEGSQPNNIGPKREWDLGLSSEFTLEIPGFNPIFARPTWVPQVEHPDTSLIASMARHQVPYQELSFGTLRMKVTQLLQPGSIYPSSVRILVFISFPDSQHYISCDPRSFQKMSIAYPLTSIIS